MCDPRTVIEGSLKYRDGRKWKSRWCVVSKLSPVAAELKISPRSPADSSEKDGPWPHTDEGNGKAKSGIVEGQAAQAKAGAEDISSLQTQDDRNTHARTEKGRERQYDTENNDSPGEKKRPQHKAGTGVERGEWSCVSTPDRVDVSWTRSELAQTRQRSRHGAPSRGRRGGRVRFEPWFAPSRPPVCCCEDFGCCADCCLGAPAGAPLRAAQSGLDVGQTRAARRRVARGVHGFGLMTHARPCVLGSWNVIRLEELIYSLVQLE
ncbi:hypothetical protein HPB49_009411 [Dermacentor silvarum]|uniref:Uncharacterized protein n=1 Tax=Dermacentor silvarum TaxID=543639 RepID=A0ACB8DYB3_DERSI|nr:hypothetical protein HPB49_009411 [Dermacentor silvarum]